MHGKQAVSVRFRAVALMAGSGQARSGMVRFGMVRRVGAWLGKGATMCKCGVGKYETKFFNINPECPRHGEGTEWWATLTDRCSSEVRTPLS